MLGEVGKTGYLMHPCLSCVWLYREWLSILPGGTFAEAHTPLRREGNHPVSHSTIAEW